MDTRRWFEVPAADIPLRPDSHELGQQLRWRSSRDSLWSVHDRQAAAWTGDGAVFLSWGLVDTFAGDAIPSGGWAIGIPFGTAAQGWS